METATIDSTSIHALLAEKGYEVTDAGPNVLSIKQLDSGISVQAVLEGDILYCSLTCLTVPSEKITPELTRRMLAGDNGISTSHFQLYDVGNGQTAIALSNYCKILDMGPEDEDDILSAVHFLFADVLAARDLLHDLE